jgi:acetyl-CoA carboxylase biotin carboxyl carrier protein
MAKKAKTEAGASANKSSVDLGEVERLLTFMQQHGLEEFEYERGGFHIRLKKPSGAPQYIPAPATAVAGPAASSHAAGAAQPPSAAPASPSPAPTGEATPAASAEEDLHVVKSPIVGTFYSAPAPEAPAFVTVGSRVEVGQVLCIIEAMKLMNEIECDVAGEVTRIFVDNAHPVEYGAALFAIRPAGKR